MVGSLRQRLPYRFFSKKKKNLHNTEPERITSGCYRVLPSFTGFPLNGLTLFQRHFFLHFHCSIFVPFFLLFCPIHSCWNGNGELFLFFFCFFLWWRRDAGVGWKRQR